MTVKSEIEVSVAENRNLVSIRFLGQVTAEAMKAHLDGVETHLRRVRSGFTVFTDLSELESMELDCVASLTRLMELFKSRGVGTVVRLIPDHEKDIGFNILSLTHYRHGVRIINCETLDEVERALPAVIPGDLNP